MTQSKELDRIAANVLHQHGYEVTPSALAENRSYYYDVIRSILNRLGRLVPKSDHDMRRWLRSRTDGEVRRRMEAGESLEDIETDLDSREHRRAK